jgi:electron transfer flavoprotein alpha subunit
MKILVAVKQVPDPGGPVFIIADGKLDTSLARGVVNPYDEIALDVAHGLREAGAAAEVVAVSVAPSAEAPLWDETLLAALARAADRAILVTVGEGEDRPEPVAVRIAEVARRELPDLILFGRMGADSDDCQTGPRVAGILGRPFVTAASEVSVEGDKVRAVRETDAGRETLEVPLPAIVTCDLRGRDPRLIALYAILAAKGKPVERIAGDPLPSSLVAPEVCGYAAPPVRGACRMVADVAELLDALPAIGGSAHRTHEPGVGLLPASADGVVYPYVGTEDEADALAWIAGRRGLSLLNGVTGASLEEGKLRCRRGIRAGRFIEVVDVPPSRDAIVIVRGGGRTQDEQRQTAELLRSEPVSVAKRVGFEPHATSRLDMGEARVVVAGGRALHDPETFERLVGALADALGRAAVAASGGAVNSGIAPAHLLVGQTGRTVAPDLYIALGISGADQHVGGMRGARTIVAINTDPHAPIFGIADLGLVGDLNVVVPEWIARLKA